MIRRISAALLAGLLAFSTVGCAEQSSSASGKSASSLSSSGKSKSSGAPAGSYTGENPSKLGEIKESELPAEGRKTLELIRKGGPFPYSRDGITFGNYEGRLPQQSRGYYKEYTVVTPSRKDRGPKRIIVGKNSVKYYTSDHYETFKFIKEGQ